ncbi:MAG: aminotransferase class I/II-fold pyridoxal phosphate-dependent enzyme, partial [Desulfobulbaceae bacterium]|nr:aminotransferase class I/II-fold pyridoxal phosphate-dependent enzyme [Desulfobulbaceae bacterium]
YALHGALEAELADFYQCSKAMVFSTGFAANLGVLAALLNKNDAVLLDSDAHASLYRFILIICNNYTASRIITCRRSRCAVPGNPT